MPPRRPVSTPVRALAAVSYLTPVAIVLLALPQYRRIRLIRKHCQWSLGLAGALVAVVSLAGSLRTPVLELQLTAGVVIAIAILGAFGATAWSVVNAYQGREPPGARWLRRA